MNSIERLSMIDPLTNMPNRRSFDDRLVMEWKKAIREQTTISMLMLDLDRFKVINDTYGHLQGDKILQAVAAIFPKSFKRPGDFAARWGGEEFAVLLPNTPLEGAVDIAEKIRLDIENAPMPSPAGIEIKITISIGVASLIPSQDSSIDDFTSSADRALYAAKQAGRNKVIVSE
ncbi:MAG: GGDEF domain-containing protein [Treponema sp.]|nr:GGDEF domain-containing protein [Treponema sp.]